MNRNFPYRNILRLWLQLKIHRRWQFAFVLLLQLIVSILDMLSIGSVAPLLAVLISPDRFMSMPAIKLIPFISGTSTASEFLLFVTILFCIIVIFGAVIRLLLNWISSRVAFLAGSELSSKIFINTLNKEYSFHISNNSSYLIDSITNKSTSIIYETIFPFINIISSFTSFIGICLILFLIDLKITLAIIVPGAIFYILTISIVSQRLYKNGLLVTQESANSIRILQEGLTGIRHVKIDDLINYYIVAYKNSDKKLRSAQASTIFIASSPRHVIESIGLVIIALLAYWLTDRSGSLINSVPALGAIALGIQKILPLMQQVFHSIASMKGGTASLNDALELLESSIFVSSYNAKAVPFAFERNIELKSVSFRYNRNSDWLFKEIDLEIPKGKKVGIIGETGSGKSTLLDIIVGLLTPELGALYVDGIELGANVKNWQARIGQVEQSVFLIDDTVRRNIALGVSDEFVDMVEVRNASATAQILDFIESLPQMFDTNIGENGSQLSGGQRQRLAIARALYKKCDILVLDESTSALDRETERAIIDSIESLPSHTTVILVTHNQSVLRNFDCVYKIENKMIHRVS